MAGLLSKLVLSSAVSLSVIFSIPSTTTYVRPPERPGELITAVITSYNSVPEQTDDTPFDTASGTHVHDGTLACPKIYAFGTQVEIAGKVYTCEDRMNQKFPDRFDIWMEATSSSAAWGTRTMQIKIFYDDDKHDMVHGIGIP